MISYLKLTLNNLLRNEHERTSLIRKNILFTSLLKIGTVSITFLVIPLTINYVNPVRYGIWLTIAAIVNWFSIFDIGIGNGLKNQIAFSIARKDESDLRKYVSTAYALFFIIAVIIFVLFCAVNYFLDWNRIINVPKSFTDDISPVVILVVAAFCIQFVLQLINAVLSATQQIFKSTLISFICQLAALIVIYILTLYVPGNLMILVLAFAGTPILIQIGISIYLFSTEFKRFAPSFKNIDSKYVNKLLNIGGTFFLIQIGAMILIHSNNFIIARVLGPEAVTTYNIPARLFSFISMLFAIVIMPYWSAFTDAYAKNDFEWIKDNIKNLRAISFLLSILGLVVLIFSGFLYKLWIGNAVVVPFVLSLTMLIYVIIFMWHTLHVYFLNGIGKIRLQLLVVTAGVILNIPLAVWLGNLYGLPGIVSANAITFLWMGLIYSIQYSKIVNKTATKIWNK